MNEAFFPYKDFRSLYTSTSPSLKRGEVVLTESCAKLVFGQENPIGKKVAFTCRMEPSAEVNYYTISDVIKEPYQKETYRKVNLFFSFQDMPESEHLKVEVILTPHQSADAINETLKHRKITYHEQTLFPKVVPHYLSENDTAQYIAYFLILLIASLVLIAGLINFLKFSIQSFYNRMRELGLRKCLGSSSSGLFMILFSEIFIMLLVSLLVSMALSEWLVPYLYTYLPQRQTIEILVDMPDLFALQTAIISVTMLLCSAIAWIVVMHIRHISIRQNIVGVGQYGKHFFRNAMIGLQLAIGIFFASSAMGIKEIANDTLNRSYMPLPIDEYKERLELELSNSYLVTRSEEIHALLKQLPDVIATVSTQPARYIEYRTNDQINLPGSMISADEHYLSFFRIEVLRGDAPKTDSNDVVYISEAFDEILRKDSVQGTVKLGNTVYRIGGVYKALPNEKSINSLNRFSVYKPTKAKGSICLQVRAGKQESVQQQIENICRRYVPETIPLA
ncbi:MAG: ABC transporter permease, partial [Bacteroides sp.]